MRFFQWAKDGGEKSNVWGFFFLEFKKLFSVVLLKFEGDSREAFHTHAFPSINFPVYGDWLVEERRGVPGRAAYAYKWMNLFWVPRSRFHKVSSGGTTWVLSFRGPWSDTWKEYDEETKEEYTLTHGRERV